MHASNCKSTQDGFGMHTFSIPDQQFEKCQHDDVNCYWKSVNVLGHTHFIHHVDVF